MPDKKLESMVQDMMDAHESDQDIDAAIHLYKEEQNPTLSELKGVLEGIIPGAWGAIRGALYDLPKGVIDDTLSVLKGETPEAAKAFVEGIAKAPQEFMDATHEERGKMIGNLLGSMGVAKYAPMTPKPIARGVGTVAEKVGTTGAWPIRMMGAHQLGSGNPMGIPIMAIPEVLKKGGAALKKWGSAPEGPAMAPVNKPLTAFQSNVESGLTRAVNRLPNPAKAGLSDIDAAIADAKKEAAGTRATAAKGETTARTAETKADVEMSRAEQKAAREAEADRVQQEKASKIEAERAGMEPGKKSFSKSLSAPTAEGGTQTMRQGFRAPKEAETGSLSARDLARLEREGYPSNVIEEIKKQAAQQGGRPIAPPTGAGLGGVQTAAPPPAGSQMPPVRLAPNPMGGAPLEPPAARAWSSDAVAPPASIGKGIPREPPRLVLTPEQAQMEEQQLRAHRPSARTQGMKAAARVPLGEGLTDLEMAQLKRLLAETEETP